MEIINKQDIINALLEYNRTLNKNVGRRDIPRTLNNLCVKNFGSFNNAKIAAGLKICRRTCPELSEESKKHTLELVRIVACLTGDGHLRGDLKEFLFSSKDINALENFNNDVNKQFGIIYSKIEMAYGSYGEGYQYRYFNTNISKFLYSIGTPKGDKVITPFDVPKWIKKDKEFMREYIKLLFYCEGYKSKSQKPQIAFAMAKATELLKEGIRFMISLKEILEILGIEITTICSNRARRRKKDNKETHYTRFYIKRAYVDKFIKEIGWLK